MTNDPIDRLGRLSSRQKLSLLSRLAFDLTVAARGTYEVGSDGVSDAVTIRRYNEVQHRIADQLVRLTAGEHAPSDESAFRLIVAALDELGGTALFQRSLEAVERLPAA
jgi:hypothetical protein